MEIWQGRPLTEQPLWARLDDLELEIGRALGRPLEWENLLSACGALSQRLQRDEALRDDLRQAAVTVGSVSEGTLLSKLELIADFLRPTSLRQKRSRELGETASSFPRRFDYRENLFEAYQPLGLLVHIASGNSLTVGFLSVVEGLMAGNVNLLKTSRNDHGFSARLLLALAESDPSESLAPYLYCTELSSKQTAELEKLLGCADGIAVWGGESAVAAVRQSAPSRARVIPWGHKISFAFVAAEAADQKSELEALAADCVWNEQQACSSPQVVYLETDSVDELHRFAERFATILDKVSRETPALEPPPEVAAEITTVTEVHRIEALEGGRRVLEGPDRQWRILVEPLSPLQASPLFRTVWLKPLGFDRVVETLRPMREYLQTVGLIASPQRYPELSQRFFVAGVQRVRPAGRMARGYIGEPHDGVYALSRYSRRVSVDTGQALFDTTDFSQYLKLVAPPSLDSHPITNRDDFQKLNMKQSDRGLLVRSGGSSAEPVYSVFDYEDYRHTMLHAADGLVAAGLDPRTDRCMNMFASGKLYGGFLSFFTILEQLQVLQFPEGQHDDYQAIAERLESLQVNTLLGMPASLMKLFSSQEERLSISRPVKKIFFGGDHLNPAQMAWLRERFGVELIRSAAYGSNELGPMGYQAWDCRPGAHYLHQEVMHQEILDLMKDRPVSGEEIGRLVFSPIGHRGEAIRRYDIGDLGRWVERASESGRKALRFQLLGKKSDLISLRQGSTTHILTEQHANVLVGVPTTLLHLAEYIRDVGPGALPLSAVYFGGESMYPDQREFLSQVFPGARLSSIGYASVDAGLLGRADLSCGPDEHRVIDRATILEIVDEETGQPIEETGRAGKVLITNLTRSLMPIIRYPAGDRAEWAEPPGPDRKFRLLGRSEEGARVGPMTIYYEDMHSFLISFAPCPVSSFQMRVTHADGADTLELRLVPREGTPEQAVRHTEQLLAQLAQERPMISMLQERAFIHPVRVAWLRGDELAVNSRTGKLRHVIDERKGPTS